jgi:hypothetical protein
MLVAFNIEKSDVRPMTAGGCGFTRPNQQLHRAEPVAEGRILYSGGRLRALALLHRFSRCKASENAAEMYLYRPVTLGPSLLKRLRVRSDAVFARRDFVS